MTRKEIELHCEEYDIKVVFMDGYDDCIEGLVERFGMDPVVCYDKEKVDKYFLFTKIINCQKK